MKFLSDILAKAGLTVDGVVTLNNTATGQTPAANDNSTKLATTAWVRTFVQPYSLPIASASILGGVKVGSGLSIDSGTGVLSVTGGGAASIKSTQTFIATGGQTVFTVTGGYTAGLIDVFLNGVYLSPNQTTATNGTTVVLDEAAAAGDIIDVIVVSPIYEGATTTTDQLPEGVVNLYYTNARARAAVSLTTTGTAGLATYDSGSGVLNIPNYGSVLTNYVPYTGATGNVNLGTYGLVSDYLQLNTSPTSVPSTAGTMAWNDADGTLDIKLKGGNVTLQVGQETLYEVRNERGTTIPNGTAVYANGVTAGSSRITVDAYIADGSIRENRFLGLATEDISNGVNGFVTHFGYVRGLDTRGTAVSSISVGDENWSVGDILYVHPTVPGKLTNVKPQHEVTVAIVINRHQSSGVLFVRPSSAGHLEDIHDISIASPSNGDILQYVSSTGLWTKAAGTTTSIAEGTNLYYTTARANTDFDTRLATKSTTNLAEGTNLYYTDARVGTYLTANSYATQTYVNTAVSNLVDAAPGTLDTLNELAAALGDDPNFATTVATSIGTKEPIITAGTTSQYWRGDKTWQTLPIYTLSGLGGQPQLNGTGFVKVSGTTVSYDNSTYYLASNPSGYITGNQNITLSGEVTGTGATSIVTTIANNAVTTAKINNGAVTAAKLATFGAGEGLSWAANTDGASITFESTGDGGSGGRALSNLVIALIDNADEGLIVTSDNVELFFVNTNQIQYKGANLATQSYVTSQGYLTGITSLQVTNALGFTPYNATNPSGYITSSALTTYLPLAGGIMTGVINMAGTQIILSSGFAGIEYHNTSGQWEGFVGTESGTGHLRYNSRLGNHTWYSNSSQAMKLNSGGTLDIYRIRAGGSTHDYEASEGVIRMQNNQANHNYIVSNGADWGSWNQWIRYIAGYNTWRIGTYDAAQESGESVWRLAGRNRSSNAELNYIVVGPRGAWGSSDRVILWNPYARYDGGSYNGDGTHYKILDAFNYNDYAPTKTGGGASGSWSINVTGTAASETLGTVTGRGATTSTAIQVNAKIGASDDNGLHLRGYSDVTHRLYYSTTRVGIILEINNTFNIDFYNNGSPSTPFTFTTNGILNTAASINAGDSVTLQGELYFGSTLSNRYFRLVKSGTAESAGILNYQFYTGAGWFTRSTLNSSGNVTYTGTLETGGNVGIRIAPSTASDTYLKTGDAGIAYQNTYFGTGQVRIGGGSDHATNVVLSVAPGVVNFDRPGVAGGAFRINSDGTSTFGKTVTVAIGTTSEFALGVNSNSTFAFGSTNGRRAVIIAHESVGDSGLQFGWNTVDKTGIIAGSANVTGAGIDFYTYNGSAWANRVRLDKDGKFGIGANPTQKLNVDGLRGQPATSGTTQNGLFRISTLSTGYGEALDMGFHVGVDGPASYGWIQSTNQGDLSVNYRLMLNPNGGQVFIGTTSALQGAERFAVTSSTNTAILAKFTGGGNQGWGTKIWNDGTTGNNLILEFLTESSITARGSVRYDRTGDRLNIVGEGNGILFTGVGSFTGSTASVDSIRLYNTDGNYSYIRTTPASNTNNTWFDTPLGATLWLGWDNPGQARTSNTFSQVYIGTGRGTTDESARIHRGNIEGRDGSSNISYRIAANTALGNHTYFNVGNFGIGTSTPLSIINNSGLQIAKGGHTTLMIGDGSGHGGVLQSSDNVRRMFMGANVYDDVSNSWSQFVDDSGYAAFDAIGATTEALARILVGKPNQSGYSTDNIFFEAYNSNGTSYLKLRTATDNALYIANSGKIAIGGNNPSLRLSVLETGTVISGGNVTFASQAQGLEIYNNTSGTTDNLVGCWFSTGPHKAGIASGRTNAASTWAVDLRFFVHGPEIASLDNTYEKMRLGGDGTLVVTGDVVAYGSPSDVRLKDIKEKVPNALESIKKLNGYRFDWKQTDHLKNIKEDIGVIAQEVEVLFPELARTNDDGFMSVRYQGLTAVLIEAIKEQQGQIESQKSEIEELKDLVKQLINR